LKEDAAGKNQSIPDMRVETDEEGGKVISSDYFKYLVLGRGPGKRPPKEAMLAMVKKKPDMLANARKKFKYMTEEGLAYIIGKAIGDRGTLIFQGKKPGIDFLGSMDKNMPELLKAIGRNEAVKFLTALRTDLNGVNSK
jgi:hypothetical protein